MTALTFDNVVTVLESGAEFSVDFDKAWQWLGYSRKDVAKDSLLENFELEVDYIVLRFNPETDNHKGFSPQELAVLKRKENIKLTVDCFKSWAMMAGTARGKEVRKYFIQVENAFGTLRRETGASKANGGGGQGQVYYWLNEDQERIETAFGVLRLEVGKPQSKPEISRFTQSVVPKARKEPGFTHYSRLSWLKPLPSLGRT